MARLKKTAAAATNASNSTGPTMRRTYESGPVPKQVTFPARRKIVKTYGGRRSLPARLETPASERTRRSLRQQTLTQIDYVRSSSGLEQEDGLEDRGLREEGLVAEEEEVEVTRVTEKRRSERNAKRRKTMGDAPTPAAPRLERKGSSFYTQTLTQFMGKSASASGMEMDDGLRVEDEDEEREEQEDDDLPLPKKTPTPAKRSAPLKKGKGKAVAPPDPRTPSHKRIRVNLDEVPSSQPTIFTPLQGHSPLPAFRSPLTQKSINLDAPLPTVETISKLPRTLVIQESYSDAFPSSSVAAETPKRGEETPSQKLKREPLSELPVASLELGVGSTPNGEAPTTRRKRMFVEIPDSDDELESIGSTPCKALSTQQTPVNREGGDADFVIAADPGSASRPGLAGVSGTPASVGRSDKENESPALKVWDDGGSTASEGSPTPRLGTRSQTARAAGRASQVSPNTASQFWTASAEDTGPAGTAGRALGEALTELVPPEEPAASEDEAPGTPTPAPRASQLRAGVDGSAGKIRQPTPLVEDSEETASEAEDEPIPISILRKPTSQKASRTGSGKKRKSTPEIVTSESASDAPGTPTPVVRRVQIELPPPSTAEEVYKETPRKPHKSSPIYQRHTQARSQYYSQGLESQRIPMEVIRALGPQTDRSDIIISIHPEIVDGIVKGDRDHEFRNYKFPIQVSRCWIYTTQPVGEVKYMATLGPAQGPGQVESDSGLGNAEFNAGKSGYNFAHKLLQVYQLNNPVPLEDMPDNGLGDGPPNMYRYLPPAIVGQLLANLRCGLFEEEGSQGSVTISQELEDQLRSDIVQTQRHHHEEEEEEEEEEEDHVIPASQSPVKHRSAAATGPRKPDDKNNFVRPPVPPPTRSSQRLRNRPSQTTTYFQQPFPNPTKQPTPSTAGSKSSNFIRPSQATTASDMSIPSSSAVSSPAKSSSGPASVPRPPMPESSELSLPGLADMDDDSLVPLPLPRGGSLLLSSSQGGVLLPPDSLLVDEVRMAPPPVKIWDSDDEGEEEEEGVLM
ncbi:hypothetical protein C8A00DRAFT_31449 [Chaetomidium leptoderma]|uniref:Uncharacterized protein n=1 Tax=Chaetomidium leptoderma TaxID=669021 RepID=A0AAN6VQH8_9PEZI|nr:hypothetical protein C8A00DRAFT_31449 [Chaetomidium leptoderma]